MKERRLWDENYVGSHRFELERNQKENSVGRKKGLDTYHPTNCVKQKKRRKRRRTRKKKKK